MVRRLICCNRSSLTSGDFHPKCGQNCCFRLAKRTLASTVVERLPHCKKLSKQHSESLTWDPTSSVAICNPRSYVSSAMCNLKRSTLCGTPLIPWREEHTSE